MMHVRLWVGIVGLSGLMALGGCTAQLLHRDGMAMIAEGQLENGLEALARAVQADPNDVVLRKDYYMARSSVVANLLQSARQKQLGGDYAAATAELRRVQVIEPANTAAAQELQDLRRAGAHDQTVTLARHALETGDTGQAGALLRSVLADNPRHRAALNVQEQIEQSRFSEHFTEISLTESYPNPMNLEFRDAHVRQILEAMSRTSDINFIFDKDVPSDVKTTVILRNATIDDAIGLILRNSQLRRKILNKSTVQIYPDTPEKRKEYQELVVRAFYLHDASAVQIQNVLKSLLKLKDIVVDERLNLVTVRDTPEAIRLAERLVALHDLAEPEVMLELEVLEIQRDDLLKFGVQWPNQFSLVLPAGSAGAGSLTLDELKGLNSSRLGLAVGNPTLNLRQDVGMSNLLANPRIRVHNREKANILIGDKVPVITTTSNATGFVAENVQYLDVGLKLTAEPVIHPSSDVSIRLNLEVSSIANQVSTPNGSVAYQVGTRNASTFLRLRDGETQVLAGLINDQDRRSASGVPGLSRLPLIGRLFAAPQNSSSKTEIVLSITPRVVRPALRSAAQPVEFWSGTENGLDTRPLRLADSHEQPKQAASAAPAQAGAPSVSAGPPQALQFIWGGPNQIKVGEEVTLSMRVIAPPGMAAGVFRVGIDNAVFDIVEAVGQDEAGANSVSVDRAAHEVVLGLSAPMDGQLLALKLRARVPAAASPVRVVGPAPGNEAAGVPYAITVQP